MDEHIYRNSETVFSHLDQDQEEAEDMPIYGNVADQTLRGKQSHPVAAIRSFKSVTDKAQINDSSPEPAAEDSGAPYRCIHILLAVLCLALLCGLTALGILYVEKSNTSDSLEARNNNLSVLLSAVEQRLAESTTCGTGWKKHQGKLYYFSTEKMNWNQSRDYCISKGAHLVIIKSQQEQEFVSSSINESHWIGLSDQVTERQWLWVDNTPLNDTETQPWWSKEPDNWTGGGDPSGEDCGSLGDYNGHVSFWFDASCGKIYHFVCEAPSAI
ncbi:hypothetical protein AAFF_G00232190 [Aldrovandia affinis]|uniref:C-type lectin domain-containing protein n=1 Tax=Aldrovandia affinis TaxID=143900 RepID=A0AAD7RFM8_9TELE|nr:hypothetical protein AAFF_G00232190 [Aldrovandia affinis]